MYWILAWELDMMLTQHDSSSNWNLFIQSSADVQSKFSVDNTYRDRDEETYDSKVPGMFVAVSHHGFLIIRNK